MSAQWPSVSIIQPVLDEVEFIDAVLTNLLKQDYEGPMEIIVADGGSADGTRERLSERLMQSPQLTVIDNPKRRQAFGLNLAAAEASGEILIRADGHTSFAPDYVRKSIEVLAETDGAVGGRMRPQGRTGFGRAVAAAMESPLTMRWGRFHHAEEREQVDTVYLGAFPKSEFRALGGFRSFPSGTSEDADFYYRWRKSGKAVFVDPSILSSYTPRESPNSLWRQYFRYGSGKAEMWWVNGHLPSWRPLAPLGLVVGILGTTALGSLRRVLVADLEHCGGLDIPLGMGGTTSTGRRAGRDGCGGDHAPRLRYWYAVGPG